LELQQFWPNEISNFGWSILRLLLNVAPSRFLNNTRRNKNPEPSRLHDGEGISPRFRLHLWSKVLICPGFCYALVYPWYSKPQGQYYPRKTHTIFALFLRIYWWLPFWATFRPKRRRTKNWNSSYNETRTKSKRYFKENKAKRIQISKDLRHLV
jgi:hypothetical protein